MSDIAASTLHPAPAHDAGRKPDHARDGFVGLFVLLIAATALVLRLPRFSESLWYDELWSTRIMLGSASSLVRV
ncbi:MAG: hypothetical protein ACREJC_06980, partial [Tepidisphaeraceae bacterium]